MHCRSQIADRRSIPMVFSRFAFCNLRFALHFWNQPHRGVLVGLTVMLLVGCDGPPPAIKERVSVVGHASEVVALAYSPDGRTLASRAADSIKVWDASDLKERASLPSDRSDFGTLAISPDGRTLAATLVGRGVVAWDLASHEEREVFRVKPASDTQSGSAEAFGWGLAYSPDGSMLAGPSEDRTSPASILVWTLANREATGLGPPSSPATHLAFTPDNRSLIAKGMEGRIKVWDVESKAERTSIATNTSYLTAISVSPDGKSVASSGPDRYLRLWSVASGVEVGKLKGHMKAILGIAFHPDGRHVVTGDSAGTIFLWDLKSRRAIAQFKGHQGKVWAVAFRPDGQEMATAGEDRHIRLWNVAGAIKTYGR